MPAFGALPPCSLKLKRVNGSDGGGRGGDDAGTEHVTYGPPPFFFLAVTDKTSFRM